MKGHNLNPKSDNEKVRLQWWRKSHTMAHLQAGTIYNIPHCYTTECLFVCVRVCVYSTGIRINLLINPGTTYLNSRVKEGRGGGGGPYFKNKDVEKGKERRNEEEEVA